MIGSTDYYRPSQSKRVSSGKKKVKIRKGRRTEWSDFCIFFSAKKCLFTIALGFLLLQQCKNSPEKKTTTIDTT